MFDPDGEPSDSDSDEVDEYEDVEVAGVMSWSILKDTVGNGNILDYLPFMQVVSLFLSETHVGMTLFPLPLSELNHQNFRPYWIEAQCHMKLKTIPLLPL